jgi:hypothetical protein
MKRPLVVIISILICVFWALLITPRFVGVISDGLYYLVVLLAWLLGWIPIWTIAYFLLRKKNKKISN